MSEPDFIECRMSAKITLAQCLKRQLAHRRYDVHGLLNWKFHACFKCQHWLSDGQYNDQRGLTANQWRCNNRIMERRGRRNVAGISHPATNTGVAAKTDV